MKNKLFYLVIFLCPLFSFGKMNFSGVYTIGGSAPNFSTLNIALDSLKKGLVVGKTTFKIRKGTYNEKLIIPVIKGTSFTNTVTFESETGINTDVIITNGAGGTSGDHAVIKLRKSEFIYFNKLTVINTNPSIGSCFFLTKSCVDIGISNCILKTDSTISTGQYVMRANIVIADTPIIETKAPNPGLDNGVGVNASNVSIVNNIFSGGDVGLVFVGGSQANLNVNYTIQNNYFSGHAKGGFRMKGSSDVMDFSNNVFNYRTAGSNSNFQALYFGTYLSNAKIHGNRVYLSTNNNNLSYGFFMSGLSSSSFSKNKIENASLGAINISYGSDIIVSNNTATAFKGLATQNVFGIQIVNGSNIKLYHNSINMNLANNQNATNFACVIDNGSRVEMVNNIFFNSANGPVISCTTEALQFSNFNNFYTAGSVFSYYDGQTAANLKTWNSQTEQDDRSLSTNPNFISATNLHTLNPLLDGKGLFIPEVTDDIDEELRNIFAPDIGADEFYLTYPKVDLGLSYALPVNLIPNGNVLTVTLKNFGTDALDGKTVDLSYSTDGGTSWSPPETVNLNSLSELFTSKEYSFNQTFSFISAGIKNIKIKIVDPPTGDANAANNTYSYEACLGLISNTYTIGTGGDFPTISSALLMLKNLSCGIAGKLTFNIKSGTYNERLTFVPVKGASEKNTITFQSQSGNKNDVIITSRGGAANIDYHTVRLLHASYYNFNNLTIENTNPSFGAAVQLAKYPHHIKFSKCNLRVDTTPIEDNSVSRIAVLVADSGSSGTIYVGSAPITGNSSGCDYITIDSSTIVGMDYALYFPGGSRGNKISNNFIVMGKQQGSTYSGAMYADGQYDLLLENNFVQMSPVPQQSTRNGFHIAVLVNSRVNNNTVKYANNYGIGIFYSNNSVISNNKIIRFVQNVHADGTNTNIWNAGLYFSGCNNSYILHNSVLMDLLTSTSAPISTYCIRVNAGKNLTVKNNIFSNTGGGYIMYNTYTTGGNPLAVCDYNNYFYPSGSFGRNNTIAYPTLASWKTSLKLDSNSINVDPLFKSNIDLHTVNPELNAKGSANQVKTDMDYEPRNIYTPDIGADEFIIEEIDLGINDFSPVLYNLGANDNVKVSIINHGKNSLQGKSFSLSYSIDTGKTWTSLGSYTVQNLLTSYSTEWVNLTKSIDINKIGQSQICIRIEPGSLTGDIYPRNDKICKDVCVSLQPGTYSVGSSGADFTSLSQVVKLLKSAVCPIAGNLVFELQNGTYTDTLLLDSNIHSSENSTITFQSKSGNYADAIIQSNGDLVAQSSVIRCIGNQYIYFKNLTIKNLGTQNGTGILIEKNSTNIGIENCKIIVDSVNQGSFAGISILNSPENIVIRNNIFSGGNYGVTLFGGNEYAQNRNVVKNNVFTSCYGYGIYVQGDNLQEISGNKIYLKNGNEFGIGIFVSDLTRSLKVSNNYLVQNSFAGILFEKVNAADFSLISNNMIAGGFFDNLTGSGIYLNNSKQINIYHNSVVYDAAGSKAKVIRVSGSNNIDIKNNILINKKDGYTLHVDDNNSLKGANYNVHFTNGSNLAYVGANKSFAELQTMGFEQNGFNTDVNFLGTYDLHTASEQVDNKGIALEEVKDDYDGQPRNTTNPDIGCDEFSINGIDAYVSKVELLDANPSPGMEQSIKISIGNLGTVAATGIVLKYSVKGQTLSSETYPSTLAPGGLDSYTFDTKWTPAEAGRYEICGTIIAGSDINSVNDVFCKEFEVAKVGINADLKAFEIYVYPNPNFGIFKIEMTDPTNAEFLIHDMLGRIVKKGKLSTQVSEIHLQNFTTGMYNLIIFQGDKMIKRRLIIN